MSTSTHVITPTCKRNLKKGKRRTKKQETQCFSTAQDANAWIENL